MALAPIAQRLHEGLKAHAAETSLGRIGEPEDVADVIASLLSRDTRWINGQRVEVTGGYRL